MMHFTKCKSRVIDNIAALTEFFWLGLSPLICEMAASMWA
jgi:hypothetical protein